MDKKYAVAVYNYADANNEVKVVWAKNLQEAIFKAVGDDPEEIGAFDSVAQLIDYYADGDFFVSFPVEI